MLKLVFATAAIVLGATPAPAEPTRVMVRARSLDAKFIGDHTGGVRVTLRDARTGKVLAQGVIRGGTGDTTRLMKTPAARYAQVADEQTAGFPAVIDISEPTRVRVEATGPLKFPQAEIAVTSTLWVAPGRHIDGDGVVLTFPGLIVDPTATQGADGAVRVVAKISPMCGCPIEQGGLWNADNYSVRATLLRKGAHVAEAAMTFTGKTGEYAAVLPAPGPGRYSVRVVAVDAKTPNTGVGVTEANAKP